MITVRCEVRVQDDSRENDVAVAAAAIPATLLISFNGAGGKREAQSNNGGVIW